MSRAYDYSSLGEYGKHADINYLLRDYAQVVREVAAATHVPLVDLFALFTERPDGLSLIPDGNHPWPPGHALIAEALRGPVSAELAQAQ
jgi:lysophospholipase L1-like esterase